MDGEEEKESLSLIDTQIILSLELILRIFYCLLALFLLITARYVCAYISNCLPEIPISHYFSMYPKLHLDLSRSSFFKKSVTVNCALINVF